MEGFRVKDTEIIVKTLFKLLNFFFWGKNSDLIWFTLTLLFNSFEVKSSRFIDLNNLHHLFYFLLLHFNLLLLFLLHSMVLFILFHFLRFPKVLPLGTLRAPDSFTFLRLAEVLNPNTPISRRALRA